MTKKITQKLLIGLMACLGFSPGIMAQTDTITSNDFENCGVGYNEFGVYSDGSSDYFVRANGTSTDTNCTVSSASGQIAFTNTSGYYYTGEDVDRPTENPNTTGEFGSTALTSGVHFNDIDVSSFTNVEIVCSFAAYNPSPTVGTFENGDYIRIYIDKTNNGTYELLGAFETVGGGGNTYLSEDTNLDGLGNGTVLTQAFQAFTFSVTGVATTMDVRIEILSSGGSEEMAFDTFIVQGDAAVTSTTWDGATWDNGVPTNTVDAVIASSTALSSAIACKDLTINNGITFNLGANNLTVSGDVANNGSGITTTGTITFDKAGTAALSGNTISHESVVSVASGTTLSTSGLLTLTASSASSYGQLVGDGTVTGNVTVQGFLTGIDGSTARYFYLGSPVTNAALSDFNEGNTMVASNSATGTVWEWDASTSTWTAPSNISNTATSGQGFAMYAGTNTFGTFIRGTAGTIEVSGTVSTTDVLRALSYHDGQGSPTNGQGDTQNFVGGTSTNDTEGWNLIANPFPAVYDWDNQTIPTDMATAIYRYDGTNYTSYSQGAGLASRYIAPFQAFFVQLTANTPGNLTFSENNRVTGQGPSLGKTNSYVVDGVDLNIFDSNNSVNDYLFIGFDGNTSLGFDLEYDARKLLNGYGVPNIYTQFNQNTYSICRVSKTDGMTSFPVYLEHAIDGEQLIINAGLNRLQSYGTVKLEDLKTGNLHDLSLSDYYFTNDTAFKANRFILHFGANRSIGTSETELSSAWFAYDSESGISVNTGDLNKATVTVRNISGQLIYRKLAHDQITHIPLSTNGVYVVTVSTSNSSSSKKIIH